MLLVCTKYSMCDLICDVISCNMDKINVYEKIVLKTRKRIYYMESKGILHQSPCNRWFRNRIHSLFKAS